MKSRLSEGFQSSLCLSIFSFTKLFNNLPFLKMVWWDPGRNFIIDGKELYSFGHKRRKANWIKDWKNLSVSKPRGACNATLTKLLELVEIAQLQKTSTKDWYSYYGVTCAVPGVRAGRLAVNGQERWCWVGESNMSIAQLENKAERNYWQIYPV